MSIPSVPSPRRSRLVPLTITTLLALGVSQQALAQAAPDAGQLLQQLKPTLQPPPSDTLPSFGLPETAAPASGGGRFILRQVRFTGNSLFASAVLGAVLGDAVGKEIDLAGARDLASRITAYYRMKGYPFTRVLIPVQQIDGGVLTIQIVEGRYGAVRTSGPARLAKGAKPFLASLKTGRPITSSRLERASLILEDQPGITIAPTIRPGARFGEGDLEVAVRRDDRIGVAVSADNQGNRFTGNLRAIVSAYINSPLLFGDRLSVTTLVTREAMWFGSADYELPIGGSGLRAGGGYSYTSYSLGKDFADLDAHGTAQTWSGRLSYPLMRSQRTNASLTLGVQHKRLRDVLGIADTVARKTSLTGPATLRFDHRDSLAGGGISYGAFVWTPGKLTLDDAQRAIDTMTARKEGHFNKLTLDLARIQRVSSRISIYGRFSGQWADSNLDSSERLAIGGPDGIRSLAVGDAIGDEGWLGQIELRYTLGKFAPFAFVDGGHLKINAKPWDPTADNGQSFSGGGAGLRYVDAHWSFETTISRKLHGAASNHSGPGSTQFWLNLRRQF